MTDYYTPTVIQPSLPKADITALERLLLSEMFDAHDEGETLYLSAAIFPSEFPTVKASDLKRAVADSLGIESFSLAVVAEAVPELEGSMTTPMSIST